MCEEEREVVRREEERGERKRWKRRGGQGNAKGNETINQ